MVEAKRFQRYVRLAAAVSAICAVATLSERASAQQTGASSAPAGDASASAAPAAYSGPPPYVFVLPPRVGAGLTPEGVHRAVTRSANQTAMTQCYTQLLASNAHAHARVSVRLEVIAGGTGTIDHVHVTPANDTLRDCLQAAIGNVEWPNPHGVPSAEVNLEIDLAPTPPPGAGHPAHH